MKDFFISYTSADQSWADWIAGELEAVGYETIHQSWDFRPGANFVSEMKKALEDCERTIAVYSPNYFNSGFSEDEWTAAFHARTLTPVRVRECEIPVFLTPIAYINLVNLQEHTARATLLSGLGGAPMRGRQPFPPNAAKPRRFPGALPDIWQVPQPRNPNFTGRDQLLKNLHAALQSGRPAALTQAIAGLGGVGKTQLALEYCYRHSSDYNVVWWMRAEEPATLASEYARLAVKLDLPEKSLASQPDIVAAVRDWLEHNSGWLLVFDNATTPEACADYRPRSTTGHILITSRYQAWRGVAEPLPVHQLSRTESVAFLQQRTGRDELVEAATLSEALGDLPLALDQAAAYIDANGISIGEYLALWRESSKHLLEPVAATWSLSIDKLKVENPPALDLLYLIAYLAPDDIPRDLLKLSAANLLEFNKSVEGLRRYSLVQTTPDAISVHRLVQETTRNRLDEADQRRFAEAAVKIVREAFPFDSDEYQTWPACSKLLTHAVETTKHAERLAVGLDAASVLLNQAGLYEKERAQLNSAAQLLKGALEIDEKVYGPHHHKVAIRANNLGQILQAQGDLSGAFTYAQRALEIDEKIYGPHHQNIAIRASNLGQILKDQGDLSGAYTYTQRALEIDEKVYGPHHQDVAIDANNLGQILQAQGDLSGAFTYTLRALEIDERVYGPHHPQVATFANNLGQILQDQGDLSGAFAYTQRALEIDEKVYGPHHPNVAIRANNLGQILQAQGDLSGAFAYTQRALEIDEKVYGPHHPSVARDASNLGQILQAQGDFSGALTYTQRALEIDEKVYGPHHPNVAIRANNLGLILQAQGDFSGALTYTQRALEILNKVYGPNNPSTRIVANNLRGFENQ